MYKMDNAVTFDGAKINTYFGREDFYLDDDRRILKRINRVRLTFKDTGIDTEINFAIGSRLKDSESEIAWKENKIITLSPGKTTYKLDLICIGQIFSWYVTSGDDSLFELHEIRFDYVDEGEE